jgi:GNAT superfamily N-acetyltransferase
MNRQIERVRCFLERSGYPLRNRALLFFDKRLAEDNSAPATEHAPLRISALSAGDLRSMDYPGGWLSHDEAVEWMRTRDCQIFAGWSDGRITAYCWVERDYADLSFLDHRSQLASDTVYVSKVFVSRGARGTGIGSAIVRTAVHESGRQGKRRAVIACVPANQAMRAILVRDGWTCFQKTSYLRAAWVRTNRISAMNQPARKAFWTEASAAIPVMNCFSVLATTPEAAGAGHRVVHRP